MGSFPSGIWLAIRPVLDLMQTLPTFVYLIPAIVLAFRKTKQHYDTVADQLTLRDWAPPQRRTHGSSSTPLR